MFRDIVKCLGLILSFLKNTMCYINSFKVTIKLFSFVLIFKSKSSGVLSSADWKLDAEELASKFSSKTKAIVVNTPNNPLGKVAKSYISITLPNVTVIFVKCFQILIFSKVFFMSRKF